VDWVEKNGGGRGEHAFIRPEGQVAVYRKKEVFEKNDMTLNGGEERLEMRRGGGLFKGEKTGL